MMMLLFWFWFYPGNPPLKFSQNWLSNRRNVAFVVVVVIVIVVAVVVVVIDDANIEGPYGWSPHSCLTPEGPMDTMDLDFSHF